MKKLMLDLDALAVDSFSTGDAGDGRGTVRGHDTRFTEFCTTKKNSCQVTCVLVCAEEDLAMQPARIDEPFE